MQVTQQQKQKAIDLYNLCKNGKAPNQQVKADIINLYNEIHNTKYRINSNCGACLNTVFNGIKHIATK